MAKPSKIEEKTAPAPPRRHRQLRQREAKTQRLVLLLVGIGVGLAVLFVAAGLINEYVLKPRRPIALVNGRAIPVAAFQRRLRFQQDNLSNQIAQYLDFGRQVAGADGGNPFADTIGQLANELAATETFSLQVLDDLIEEELIEQLAAQYNVVVTEEDVQLAIEQDFGYERNPAPTPTPDPTITTTVPMPTPMTAEAFQQRYNEVINGFKERHSLTEAEFRRLYRLRLLRQKLQEVAPLDVATTEEQVHARHILIRFPEVGEGKTQEQAEAEALARIQEIRRRIEAGESFADVAKEVSEDPGSKENGGDLGWFGRGRMVAEFEEAAFALEPGQISEPVKTAFGYHLIEVLEKDPARPVDEATLAQRRQQAFSDWLVEQQNAAQIERRWRSDLVPELPADLRQFLASVNTALAVPVPTATPTPAS